MIRTTIATLLLTVLILAAGIAFQFQQPEIGLAYMSQPRVMTHAHSAHPRQEAVPNIHRKLIQFTGEDASDTLEAKP